MANPQELKSAIERLIAGVASEDDRRIVLEAQIAGRLIAEGERSVAIGGDAKGAVIITGDQAQVKLELSPDAYKGLRDHLFPPPHGIPPPFPDLVFIGREEAVELVKGMLGLGKQPDAKPRQVIVRGWPGVGKTTLVSVISRDPDIARVFTDGVLWTSLDQEPNLMSILAAWARALGNDQLLRAPTEDDAANELHAMLHDKRMLLIVDDVWKTGHGGLFQRTRGSNCGLLFTTRITDVAEHLTPADESIYVLPPLSPDDAVKLMRILAPSVVQEHPDECRQLVMDLERLPLALHVAARLLRVQSKRGLGVARLIDEIRSGAKVINADAPADREEHGKIPTVTALLRKSTDVLDPTTREYFACLGVFPDKPATFDIKALSAVWDIDDPSPVVNELVGRGLLEPASGGRFQLHALLKAHARSLLS